MRESLGGVFIAARIYGVNCEFTPPMIHAIPVDSTQPPDQEEEEEHA